MEDLYRIASSTFSYCILPILKTFFVFKLEWLKKLPDLFRKESTLSCFRRKEFSTELETYFHLMQCVCFIAILYTPEYKTAFQFGEMLAKVNLKELSVRLNNIIRNITFSRKYCLMTPLYKTLNLLKLNDIYKLG